MQPKAPDTHRQYSKTKSLNDHSYDYNTTNGIRFCQPLYIDPTMTQRKEIYNAVRTLAETTTDATQSPTASGLRVESSATSLPAIEGFLGCSLDLLRSQIFVRGGMQLALWLKLQKLTGLEYFTEKDVTASFRARAGHVKEFMKELESPV